MTNYDQTTGYPAPPPLDTSQPAEASASAILRGKLGVFFDNRFCGYCGHDFGQVVPISICNACDAKVNAEREDEEKEAKQKAMKARMIRWAEWAGKFAPAAPSKLPLDCQRDILEKWQPGLRFGVTITGDGLGKSWLVWLLLKKAWAQGLEMQYRIATEMKGEIMALARNGDTTPVIRKLVKLPILAIDDFGLASPTPAADELWAKLLELRSKEGRPTIIASPYEGGALASRFSDPIAGRKITKLLGTSHNWFVDTHIGTLHNPTL